MKNRLQVARLFPEKSKQGVHRKRRERAALPGMMSHQNASSHDAEEGTQSSFLGVGETIEAKAFSVLFTGAVGATTGIPR